MVTLASWTTKTKKRRKRNVKRGGAWARVRGPRNPPDPLTHSLSLNLTHTLSLSLGPRSPAGITADCHLSPARERDDRSPQPRQPPVVLHFSRPKINPNTRPLPENRPPTCRNPATHTSLGPLYKLGTEFEPKTTKTVTPMGDNAWVLQDRGWDSGVSRLRHALGLIRVENSINPSKCFSLLRYYYFRKCFLANWCFMSR